MNRLHTFFALCALALAVQLVPSMAAAQQQGTRALLRIQDGCDEHCTFCATTLARGASRSRDADALGGLGIVRLREGLEPLIQQDGERVLAAIGTPDVLPLLLAGRTGFRVVHVSIQRHHIHLLCEADDRVALANGVRALCISTAKRLNALVSEERGERRRGRVFTDRYHARFITSAKQCRSELAYVLNNWRRHREDVAGVAQRRAQIDPYSSAIGFPGWAGRAGVPFAWPRAYEPLPVSYPATWFLESGWRRGGAIPERLRPGPPDPRP